MTTVRKHDGVQYEVLQLFPSQLREGDRLGGPVRGEVSRISRASLEDKVRVVYFKDWDPTALPVGIRVQVYRRRGRWAQIQVDLDEDGIKWIEYVLGRSYNNSNTNVERFWRAIKKGCDAAGLVVPEMRFHGSDEDEGYGY